MPKWNCLRSCYDGAVCSLPNSPAASQSSGLIVESKGVRAIFQKRAKQKFKRAKKGKIFENLGKNLQNLKIVWKRAGDWVWLSHAINC